MASYPLRINVKPYRGHNKRRLINFQSKLYSARQIEEYLNKQMESCAAGPQCFDYGDIANAVGLTKKCVREILFAVGGGSNGITIGKPN